MPDRTVFMDTSFVLALENSADPYHQRARRLDTALLVRDSVLVYHWGILLEIADGYARIGRRARGLQLLTRFENEEGYRLFPITDELLGRSLKLYRSHNDKDWGLTDCILFVLMQQVGLTEALTADVHFRQAGFTSLLLEPDPIE